jgi:hypothetical protein
MQVKNFYQKELFLLQLQQVGNLVVAVDVGLYPAFVGDLNLFSG